MPVSPGGRLGPYELLSSLGAGGMGEVYRARDTRLGRDVAVKVIADGPPTLDRLHRFQQEAKALAALDDPHILALHDVGTPFSSARATSVSRGPLRACDRAGDALEGTAARRSHGRLFVNPPVIAPDGEAYAYGYSRFLYELCLIEGLR